MKAGSGDSVLRVLSLVLIISAMGCGTSEPTLGTLLVRTETFGSDLDPNGYALRLDGQEPRPIGLDDSLVLRDVAPGDHSIELGGLADNCSTVRENPLAISVVTAAAIDTTIRVTCLGPNGTLTIRTFTQGGGATDEGYSVRVDGAEPRGITRTGSIGVIVPAGTHQILLEHLTENCAVSGDNPQQVTVGREQAVRVTFVVICSS